MKECTSLAVAHKPLREEARSLSRLWASSQCSQWPCGSPEALAQGSTGHHQKSLWPKLMWTQGWVSWVLLAVEVRLVQNGAWFNPLETPSRTGWISSKGPYVPLHSTKEIKVEGEQKAIDNRFSVLKSTKSKSWWHLPPIKPCKWIYVTESSCNPQGGIFQLRCHSLTSVSK